MPKNAAVSGGVIIDGRKVPADLAIGKVLKARGNYYLQLGRKRLLIPVGAVTPEADLAKLAGKTVGVAVSRKAGGGVIAIGDWNLPPKATFRPRGPIVCYIPAPDVMRRVDEMTRVRVLEEMIGR